jgi:signal transduction histidine kinase
MKDQASLKRIKNLFQRFVKLSAQPTGEETSSGLGLFIVKTLVEAHNGTITPASEGKDKAQNSQLTFRLLNCYN